VLAACQRYEHAAVRRASAIITVDSRIRQDVIDRLGARPEQVFVIHNAVDTQRFCPVTPEVQRALKIQLNLPPEAFVVLCPRRLVRKNGGAVAARAAALLPRPAMLLLVGDGPERPAIAEALATAPADRWRWLPPISYDTVAAYYQAADPILVPSIPSDGVEEATSLTMLEGMACGKPVLCSAIGGMAEVLQAAAPARVGLPLPPGQPSAIAEAIANILSNPQEAQHLGQAARTWAEARHGYQAHARHFIDIFEHCLADHTPK
jgi:glycosyltransferase involved in cell wall biosynthesis